jgi:hypothetical protein
MLLISLDKFHKKSIPTSMFSIEARMPVKESGQHAPDEKYNLSIAENN